MAANQLAFAAYNWLSRHVTAQEAYSCRVVKAPVGYCMAPGETVQVTYHEWRDGVHVVNIDKSLYILEVTEECGPEGIRAVGLVLATVDRWPTSDADLGVSALEEGWVIGMYAQATMAYSVSGPYIRRIDSTHDAEFTCKIGPEVLAVMRATLRLKTAPLTSSVLSAAGDAEEEDIKTTDSTTWTVDTSSDYTTHSHTVQVNSGTGGADVTLVFVGGTERALEADGDSGYIFTNATGDHHHTVSGTEHEHTITIPAHGHAITPTYGLYTDTLYPRGLSVELDGTDITAAIGGPWATASEPIEVEAEIGAFLRLAKGGLRQRHRIVISATSGQGEIEVRGERVRGGAGHHGGMMAELLLALLVAGSATYMDASFTAEVYGNRLAWGQVEPCAECVGYVALLDADRIGEHVWLSFDGGATHVGPLLVFDCAAAGDRAALRRRGWAVDIDGATWQRLGLPKMPVPVQVWQATDAARVSMPVLR